jgi:hypothetical protein
MRDGVAGKRDALVYYRAVTGSASLLLVALLVALTGAAGCAGDGLPIVDGPYVDSGTPHGLDGGTPLHDFAVPHDALAPTDLTLHAPDLALHPPDLASSDMAISAAPCLTGGSVVHLDGDPGAYIFSGSETDQVTTWSPINGNANNDTFWFECSPGGWMIAFSSRQLGHPLAVGRYDNAMRFPFESSGHPGLDISGNGRGCNTETGWFEIESISGGPANSGFTELTATFEQHCEGAAPALRGCVHFER